MEKIKSLSKKIIKNSCNYKILIIMKKKYQAEDFVVFLFFSDYFTYLIEATFLRTFNIICYGVHINI